MPPPPLINYTTSLSFCLYLCTATFVPFEPGPLNPITWTPFALYDATEHTALRKKYSSHFFQGMSGLSAESEFKRLFRTFCLLSPHRMGGRIGPSGIWDQFMGTIGTAHGLGNYIGLLFDDLFLALSHPSPNREWYTQLVAL